MSDITVRRADPAEYDAVGALTVAVYRDLRGGHPGEYDAQLQDVAARAAQGEVYIAVDSDGHLLGSVTFAPHGSEYAEQSAPDEAVFRMLAVAPGARGRGAGRALVETCVDRARSLGLRRLRLSTQLSMRAAHRLYETMGFTRTPDDDWSPRPGIDLITYALDL
ncbi:MAG TPA: GNAT family N-acetyltransferase [Mycobacteriales bacterium]|nr:GNAT family N-acetyltransferase [Mycobacteriales bacterium]